MCSEKVVLLTDISQDVEKSPLQWFWAFLGSVEVGNFGMLLLGLLALISFFYGPYLIRRWRAEKSAEKMSDIAEYGLNNLYTFLDEFTTWHKFANSWIVYSRHSEENARRRDELPEKERKEFIENLNKDTYEVSNYYKAGCEIIKILKEIIYRAKRLSDPTIDEKLKALYQYVRELPDALHDIHFVNLELETKRKAKEYLGNSLPQIEADCLIIHDLFMEYLMFKKKCSRKEKNRKKTG